MAAITLQALEEASALLKETMMLIRDEGQASSIPLHEKALTVAAIELSLTFHVHKMLPGPPPSLEDCNYHSLEGVVKLLKERGGCSHPSHGGFGGADSILLHLNHALTTTVKCLSELKQSSSHSTIWMTRLKTLALVLFTGLTWRRSKSKAARHFSLGLLGLWWASRQARQWSLQKGLNESHKRLLTVLRLWIIMDCVRYYTEYFKDRDVGHITLIARPNLDDHDPQKRWLCRQMLEAAPSPSATCFWYEASPFASGLRWGMNVVYASFGAGVAVSGSNPWAWRLLGLPVTAAASMYYAMRPIEASRRASAVLSPAPFNLLQKAWTAADGPAHRWLALRIARNKGLIWQRRIMIGGLSSYVIGRQDPSSSAAEVDPPSVLFFVHGGGFVAHLFLADMGVLSSWTSGVEGQGALLVIPEYTLLPQGRYPEPIQELLRAYTAILKGELGFIPKRIAVAGESAGGNLAASLCVAVAATVASSSSTCTSSSCIHQPGLASLKDTIQKIYGRDEKEEKTTTTVVGLAAMEEKGEKPEGDDTEVTTTIVKPTPPPKASSSSPCLGSTRVLHQLNEEKGFLRLPDALILFYPVLNFCLSPSPSRAVHMSDPVLPLGVVTTVTEAYLPTKDTDPSKDPLISPYFTHDSLLRRFPPTFIGVGGFDILLDDTVDFDVRLQHLGVESTLRLGKDLPHGFFGLFGLDPTATTIMNDAGAFINKHLSGMNSGSGKRGTSSSCLVGARGVDGGGLGKKSGSKVALMDLFPSPSLSTAAAAAPRPAEEGSENNKVLTAVLSSSSLNGAGGATMSEEEKETTHLVQ